jgi:hypothetical protein
MIDSRTAISLDSTLNTSSRLFRISNTLIEAARLEHVGVHAHATILHRSLGLALLLKADLEVVVAVHLVGATDFCSGVVALGTVVTVADVGLCELGGLGCGSPEESVVLSEKKWEQ